MRYSDLGCCGGEMATPRLDALAAGQGEGTGAAWDAWAQRVDVLPIGAWRPAWRTPGK